MAPFFPATVLSSTIVSFLFDNHFTGIKGTSCQITVKHCHRLSLKVSLGFARPRGRYLPLDPIFNFADQYSAS